ncbi:Hypothetical predicted protein [Lecanosticta acicola]|uniref:Uncharacterized protein n=1 Tax=Lecanosticta acicola TaxID=111012 RepID=A0AAI9ECW5_9PEZI|nr:Hypothetical predicted protein [Lecanosticta acicola]
MSSAPQPRDNRLYTFEGRNFSQFGLQNNIHCLPIDESEERNYDQVNALFNELLGRAILPPARLNTLDDAWVLDCGFGKAAWIDTVANQHDKATIVGVDIFTGNGDGGDTDSEDESDGPDNWIRKRWNLNASFKTSGDMHLRPDTFNLINSRFLADGINADRWESYIKELKAMLEPGGWLQMVEVSMCFQSDSGLLCADNSFLARWWQWYRAALIAMNKHPAVGQELGSRMRDAGFERIQADMHRLPIGDWMAGKAMVSSKAARHGR